MYGQVYLCIVICCHVMAMHGRIWSCMVVYGHVGSIMVMVIYRHVCCMMYGEIWSWSCMVIKGITRRQKVLKQKSPTSNVEVGLFCYFFFNFEDIF